MGIKNFEIMKIEDIPYNDLFKNEIKGQYCEIKYKRDKSSFAGVAFNIIQGKNIFMVDNCSEKVVCEINKYEKLYMGIELDYINSLKDIYELSERDYGIEIKFLVYSDLRSSRIIFEELMQRIDENIIVIGD